MTHIRKLRLASLLTYLGHFLATFILSLILFLSAVTADPEGWEALGTAILLILSIVGFIYATVLLLPLLLSFLAYRRRSRGLTVACTVFDGIYVLTNLAFALSMLFSGDEGVFLFAALLLLSTAPLVLNILALKKEKRAPVEQSDAPTSETHEE